jgi:hypothetical protein
MELIKRICGLKIEAVLSQTDLVKVPGWQGDRCSMTLTIPGRYVYVTSTTHLRIGQRYVVLQLQKKTQTPRFPI